MNILSQLGCQEDGNDHNQCSQSTPLMAFTDGSCIGNGTRHAKAGYAVVFPHHPSYHRQMTMTRSQHGDLTNNRAEIYAVLEAFHVAEDIDPAHSQTLCIHSDSELLVKTMMEWMRKWKQNGWKKMDGKSPVLNVNLLQQLDTCMKSRPWTIRHVRAHTNKKNDFHVTWNALADKMARAAAAASVNDQK
jgi:ribonuclease HI